MNPINQKFIDQLHPRIRPAAAAAVNAADTALTGPAKLILTFGLRTFAEQQDIYDQGRTKPGQIVTNAKPGQSFHNYGFAVDGALQIAGRSLSWDTTKDWDGDRQSDWLEVVTAFKAQGFSWGGDWKAFKDMPHFEMTFGHSWEELLQLYHNKRFIPGTEYVNI